MACMPVGSLYLWALWGVRILRSDLSAGGPELWLAFALPAAAALAVRASARGGSRTAYLGTVTLLALTGLGLAVGFFWLNLGGSLGAPGTSSNAILWQLSRVVAPAAYALLWWWGLRAGSGEIQHQDVATGLSRNVLTMVALYLFYNSAPVIAPSEALGPILLTFVVAVAALAIANLDRMRVQLEGQPPRSPIDRYWLQTVAGVTAALVLLGLVLTGFASTRLFTQVGGALLVVLAAVAIGVSWVLAAMAVVALLVLLPLYGVLEGLTSRLALPTALPTLGALAPAQAGQGQQAATASPVFMIAGWITAAAVLATLIFMVFWLRLQADHAARVEWVDEIRESILSGSLLRRQLSSLFGAGHPTVGRSISQFLPLFNGDPRTRIRRAYQTALQRAAEHGRRRSPQQTPRAFAETLASLSRDPQAITVLTEVYLPARYGEALPAEEDAQAAEASLTALVAPLAAGEDQPGCT